ncbi:MAG: trypsin-like peptidase domain-containing protein [Acidobacteriota bacterium]
MINEKPNSNEEPNHTRFEQLVVTRYNRIILILVAVCCLSIGIAVGAVVHGIAGATDNRLTISNATFTPDSLSASFARVAAQVEPSVVHIKVAYTEANYGREGQGSGVIVNSQGYILTNEHVVKNAVRLRVRLSDGTEYQAKVVGQDPETDLAVIKIESRASLPVAKIGDSDRLAVGEWVLAIGSPLGLEQTVTAGIVSAKDRIAERNQSAFQQFIQTDAAINPGNSGGPLVNLAGEVIGINTQIITNNPNIDRYIGISLSIPTSTAVDVYNQLVANGRVRRAFLGIVPKDISSQIARINRLPDNQGVLVERPTDDASPAARAGLTGGDVIVSVNNQKVKNFREVIRLIAAQPIGSTANIAYVRGGKNMTAQVKLEERTTNAPVATPPLFDPRNPKGLSPAVPKIVPGETTSGKPKFQPSLGLNVKFLTGELARQFGMEGLRGVYVAGVDPAGVANLGGVMTDDVISEINYLMVRSLEDYQLLTSQLKSGDDVVLKIYRRDTKSLVRVSYIISFTMP